MIGSAVLWATARSSPALHRLGLVGDAVALWSRATRQRRAWSPHEERCYAAILRAVDALPARRTALVLGSGLCRDVPVEALIARFARVILVDAVHLLPVRRRYGGRAELRILDLTGFAEDPAGERADPLAPWRDDPQLDFVVSANVLSQMARPFERLAERGTTGSRDWPPDLSRRIVAGHLRDLARLPCAPLLLTDTAYAEIDRGGRIVAEWDLLHGIELGPADERWDWTVAPPGEIDRHCAFVHRAGIWHGTAALGPAGE